MNTRTKAIDTFDFSIYTPGSTWTPTAGYTTGLTAIYTIVLNDPARRDLVVTTVNPNSKTRRKSRHTMSYETAKGYKFVPYKAPVAVPSVGEPPRIVLPNGLVADAQRTAQLTRLSQMRICDLVPGSEDAAYAFAWFIVNGGSAAMTDMTNAITFCYAPEDQKSEELALRAAE